MTSEEKKWFKIPTNLIKQNFKNTPNKRRENSKKRKNSDKQSFKEVQSATGRDNKENQTMKA